MIKGLTGILLFALSLPLSSHALTDGNTLPKFQTDLVHLACGESQDVWAYISLTMGQSLHETVIPATSQEDARYFVDYADGSWIMAVEYVSLNKSVAANLMCIVAKGSRSQINDSISQPINALPREIISPLRNPNHNPQFTMFR